MAINLQKGQKISLSKESGGALSKVVMGLGWDAKTNRRRHVERHVWRRKQQFY